MFTIKSDRLTVCIAQPNVENNTCRFNRAGFVTSVVLDGQYEFCGDEHGGTKGVGLCSEITTDVHSDKVAVGEKFVKFGVGLLKKYEDAPYDAQKFYDVEPFAITAEATDTAVVFHTEPKALDGYAMREKKTVSVCGNVLRVEHEVENAGDKPFEYSEYNHNFLTLDLKGMRNSFNLTMDAGNAGYPYKWRLAYHPSRLTIHARDYFEPHHHNIWSPGWVISPEVFFVKTLVPGEKAVYVREWEFGC